MCFKAADLLRRDQARDQLSPFQQVRQLVKKLTGLEEQLDGLERQLAAQQHPPLTTEGGCIIAS